MCYVCEVRGVDVCPNIGFWGRDATFSLLVFPLLHSLYDTLFSTHLFIAFHAEFPVMIMVLMQLL